MNLIGAGRTACGATQRRLRGLRILKLGGCALVTLLLWSCKKEAPAPPAVPLVQVIQISGSNAATFTEIIGQLDSPRNVEVRARVEAFVEQILFTEGTEIKEGDLLYVLDKKPFQERLAAAEGALAEAKAALNKYMKDVARLKPLAEKRAIPQQDLDNALASVDIGKAAVQSAQAQLESATIDLGYCDVRAPISGLIGARQVSVGELVGKAEPTLLATISALDPMWFYCGISEVQYLRAENELRRSGRTMAQLPVTLVLADGSVHPAKGKFVFIDRAVDTKTGTLRVRAEFPNEQKLLRPGMFGRIKVDLGTRPDSILLPERAVAELQGRNFVWVVDADNKATQRTVKVGEVVGEYVLVVDGLKIGERVIVEGLQKVKEGAPVQPVTADEMAKTSKTETPPSQKGNESEGKAAKGKHGKE